MPRGHALHEARRGVCRHERRLSARSRGRLDRERRIRRGAPASDRRPRSSADDVLAPLAVALLDRPLDGGDGVVARQDAAQREEAGLHDRVDAALHARVIAATLSASMTIQPQPLVDDGLLHRGGRWSQTSSGPYGLFSRKTAPGVATERTSTRSRNANWWQATNCASRDEIRGLNGPGPEAQVRHRHRAGLLRVVDEVALREERRLLADDLDRVLVRADGAVRPEPVEDRAHDLGILAAERRVVCEARVRHIVHDADREVVARARLRPARRRRAFTIAGVNSFDERP